MIKLIKSATDHAEALRRIDALMETDPAPGSAEASELEVLAHLVETYEKQQFPADLPDPIEAIRFRMEQQGLSQRDLVPYFGSASRVSEVLSGKRSLNLSMATRLHEGLGIPATVLLGSRRQPLAPEVEVQRFPLKEMVARGWCGEIRGGWREAKRNWEALIAEFFGPALGEGSALALYRQNVRSGANEDPYAVWAWKQRVLHLAESQEVAQSFAAERLSGAFLRSLVGLSVLRDGPRLVGEMLRGQGIRFVIEPHLPGTHLDGAALLTRKGEPVIALTLRYDRWDNFWFTLLHEVAHVKLHIGEGERQEAFFDNLDTESMQDCETEADAYASNALIPDDEWQRFWDRGSWTAVAVRRAAATWSVTPAVVAGRIRRELGNHRILNQLVGWREPRALLLEGEN